MQRILAQAAEVSTDVTDPLSFWEYGIYFVVAILITVWVGRTLFRSGRPFLVDAFQGRQEMADSVNHLLIVGFYLVNIGFMLLFLATGSRPERPLVVAEHLTSGMATASLFTAMMDRCRPSRAASDYTVQASVVVVAQGIFSASSGHFAPPLLSYPVFFLCCAAISAVGALLAAVGLRAAPGRAAAG